MARASILQTNFTAGELSPRMAGRVDVAKWSNSAKIMENVLPLVHGGAPRRPGTVYLAESYSAANRSRLVEFIYDRQQAYVLEFSHNALRFIRNRSVLQSGGAPYVVATPWTEAQLADITWTQAADTMFLFHPDVPAQRLQRFGDTDWRLTAAPFAPAPFDEIGARFNTTLTLDNATVGAGRTATAGVAMFLAADVGRQITYGRGLATITAIGGGGATATVDIIYAFASVGPFPANQWILGGSPQTTLTPSADGPIGAIVVLTAGAAGLRVDDVGKFVRINGGLVELNGWTNSTSMSGFVRTKLTATVAAPANAWTLNAAVWNTYDGYPRCGVLSEQRLLAGGSRAYPNMVWGSRIGDVLCFELGTADDDAFAFALDQQTPIRHLARAARRILALTNSNEMSLRGGVEKPITPTNVQKSDETPHGSSSARPVRVGTELLFVQTAGRKIRALGYRYDIDGFGAPDRTVFSEHITAGGITELAYQQEPDGTLYALNGSTGQLAVAAYDPDQEVNAWTRWNTQGMVESIVTIPTAESEETYLVVRRLVNGAFKRYIEVFDDEAYLDCSRLVIPGALTTTLNVPHLAGRQVDVISNDLYLGKFGVTSAGVLTLPNAASSAWVGLFFQPRIVLWSPELGTGSGTAQGATLHVSEVVLRLLNTRSVAINGDEGEFRKFVQGTLDNPAPVFTGDFRDTTLSADRFQSELEITQPTPGPFHLLAVIRKCTAND